MSKILKSWNLPRLDAFYNDFQVVVHYQKEPWVHKFDIGIQNRSSGAHSAHVPKPNEQ